MRAQIELRERILAGDFRPGERLLEVALAEELDISRTPIRDAMARLAEEGLLERVQTGGYRVRSFALRDVADAIELRGLIEGAAARLAAERGIDAAIGKRFADALGALDAVFEADRFDFDFYSRGNMAFHETLWNASGSEVFAREAARIASLPFASPSAFSPDKSALPAFERSLVIAHDQHHRIVEAIKAGEGTRAEALAREHARIAKKNLDYVAKRENGTGLSLVAT